MEFWNYPLATVTWVVGVVIGAVATRLWQQYLQRMVTIRWSVTHETLAAGGDDPRWGRVDINYNGKPAGPLLQWCRVEIENESGSRDLETVVVRLQYDQPEPVILSGGGSLEGGNQWFSWEPSFTAAATRYFELPDADRPPTDLFRRRDFVIPVLNRGAKAIFLFLVRPNISNPTLRVYCDHLSARLKRRLTRPMVLGVVQKHASLTGLAVGALVAVALAMSLTNYIWFAVYGALLVGWFGQLIGVFVIRGWRGLKRAIG